MRKRRFNRMRDFCCCVDEVADLLKDLSEETCEVEICLTAGANCSKIKGIICGVKRNGCILEIIDTENDSKCFVPINKIASICRICHSKKGH